jgi:hypothetical protein
LKIWICNDNRVRIPPIYLFRIDICFCPVHASLASSIGYAAWQHIGSNSGPKDFAKYTWLKNFSANQLCRPSLQHLFSNNRCIWGQDCHA